MANVEHSTLSGTNLHELKGVATAGADTVATAPAGATVWAKLTAANLTGTANSFGGQLLHCTDSTGQGLTANNWTVRLLNVVTNEISGASVASNTISLPAGTYFASGFAIAKPSAVTSTCHLQLRLSDVTGGGTGTTLLVGLSHITSYSGSGITVSTTIPLTVHGRFTIGGTKSIQLQSWLSSSESATSAVDAGSGAGNRMVDLMIWKVS